MKSSLNTLYLKSFLTLITFFLIGASFAKADSWISTTRNQDIAYFLFDSPAKVSRYDLVNEVFLPDIEFSQPNQPTAFAVDNDGIYLALGSNIYRYSLDGTSETYLFSTQASVKWITVSGQNIYAYYYYNDSYKSDYIIVVDKITGLQHQEQSYYDELQGISLSTSNRKIFGRSKGYSPSDILSLSFDNDGLLSDQIEEAPYHGDYPSGSRTYLFPNQARVADDSGTVYNTSNLTYSNTFSGFFDDLDFYEDLPIVLRQDTLYSYSNVFQETGSYTFSSTPPKKIYVHDDSVFGFFIDSDLKLSVSSTPLSLLTPAIPNQLVDPTNLSYTPDKIIVGKDNIIYLLSTHYLSIFRWSIENGEYLDPIPLTNAPNYIAYSNTNHRLYLAYKNKKITQIDLNSGITETSFATSAETPLGLATANEFVFLVDPVGAWVSHYTYSPNGSLISEVEWNYRSDDYVWNEINNKMYFFRDDTSPNDILWEDIDGNGNIGQKQDSPYHGNHPVRHPIRIAPDGSTVILGTGNIYDALSLELIHSLPNEIKDALWSQNSLYTLRDIGVQTHLQEWSVDTNYSLLTTKFLNADPLALVEATINNERWFLSILSIDGIPHFKYIVMGDNLDIDSDSVENFEDNCPGISNSDQSNYDLDFFGDACDDDDDNDGVADIEDLDPLNVLICQDVDNDQCDDCSNGIDGFGPLADNTPLNDGPDQDGDGVCDLSDDDMDNDSIPDQDDNCPLIPNQDQSDGDGDGVGDVCDNCANNSNEAQSNFDLDDFGDICDPDDDNDGVTDIDDIEPFDSRKCQDMDLDLCDDCSIGIDQIGSLPDFTPNNDGLDTDYDGLCDIGDPDDDNDLVPDIQDNCKSIINTDQLDTDQDGIGDVCDNDKDNDGVINSSDYNQLDPKICRDLDTDSCDDCSIGVDGFGPNSDYNTLNDGLDTDLDGICDLGDLDDDGDNIPDINDNCITAHNTSQTDVDADGMGDACDNDIDNDGIPNSIDVNQYDPSICTDADNDGCDDCSIGTDRFGPLSDNNTSNDGIDTDGNGICNLTDPDDDGDTVDDIIDNCGLIANSDQADFDNDGIGDVCDVDIDNDGVTNNFDQNLRNPYICRDLDDDLCDDCSKGVDGLGALSDYDIMNDGLDTDKDGICNIGDSDDDGDSIDDALDNCPLIPNENQEDSDGNGVGDVCQSEMPNYLLTPCYQILLDGN